MSEKKEAINCDGASTRRRQPRSRSHKGKGAVDPWKARISPFPADRPSLGWAAHLGKGRHFAGGRGTGSRHRPVFREGGAVGVPRRFPQPWIIFTLLDGKAERKRDGSESAFSDGPFIHRFRKLGPETGDGDRTKKRRSPSSANRCILSAENGAAPTTASTAVFIPSLRIHPKAGA